MATSKAPQTAGRGEVIRSVEEEVRLAVGTVLEQIRQAIIAPGRELVAEHRKTLEGQTFGELAAAWQRRTSKRRVRPANEAWHLSHLEPLFDLRESDLTKGAIEELLSSRLGTLSASSINKLRGTGRLIIRDAQSNKRWSGPNPFELVDRYRQSKPVHNTLSRSETMIVLPKLREDHRELVRGIVLQGFRPGESFALEKDDVDLRRELVRVRRSHDRSETKTGREREFPIHREMLEYFERAMAGKGRLIFPGPDGKQWTRNSRLAEVIRTALKLAGAASGWRYRCRKYSCPFKTELARGKRIDLECPECRNKMWRVAIPRSMTFYELRHTSATLHRKAGCDPLVIQLMLGHASNVTDGTYTQLDHEYCRTEINRLSLV